MLIKKIAIKDLSEKDAWDFSVGDDVEVVTDFNEILNDGDIDCVVELMGGIGVAKTVVFGAIEKGKHVVTANKALVAAFMPELTALLAEHPEVRFGYEASVAGGIPIIHALQNDYMGDNISQLMGIMNGTTNYMLTKMESEGADYGAVLKEAQDLGYAEADPTADVEGHDVRAKIAILARLVFGRDVPYTGIPCKGISQITSTDFVYAKQLSSTIKLVGTAQRAEGGKLAVFVAPVVVPLTHPLASCRLATNMVEVSSENQGSTSFVGPGAGRFPTANSVVNDILRVCRGTTGAPFPITAGTAGGEPKVKRARVEMLELEDDYTAKFFVRIKITDGLGIIRVVGELAEKNGVSINAVLQTPITDPSDVDFVVTTDACKASQVGAFVDAVAEQSFTKAKPEFMSIL